MDLSAGCVRAPAPACIRMRSTYPLARSIAATLRKTSARTCSMSGSGCRQPRLLRTAGVVRTRRDGRTVWYRLDDEHVRMLLDLSRTHLSHGS